MMTHPINKSNGAYVPEVESQQVNKNPIQNFDSSVIMAFGKSKNPLQVLTTRVKRIFSAMIRGIKSCFTWILSCLGLSKNVADVEKLKEHKKELGKAYLLFNSLKKELLLEDFREEWRDIFNKLPDPVKELLIEEDLRTYAEGKVHDEKDIQAYIEAATDGLKADCLAFVRDLAFAYDKNNNCVDPTADSEVPTLIARAIERIDDEIKQLD